MDLILKFIYKYSFLIVIYFINFSYFQIYTHAREEIPDKSQSVGKNVNKSSSEHEMNYLLGSGDVLFIEFEELGIFSGNYAVNPEGFVMLPEIKKLYVNGLSIKEFELLLERSYEEVIIDPIINVSINTYRPVNFYLSGEIKSPGFYNLSYQKVNSNNGNVYSNGSSQSSILSTSRIDSLGLNFNNKTSVTGEISPTLFDALQKGNGLTNFADLSKIKVIRKNALSNGGGKIQANIDLLPMIQHGDQSNNIRIMDGDSIIIPKNEKPVKEQILAIYKTNLSPDLVTVFITGNVEAKGPITIKKGSGLIQAIASSGGKKLLTGNLEFIRFNDDGSTKRIKFNYDPNAKLNSAKNPILMDGDVINVEKTLLGSTTEILSEFSTPLLSGFGIYQIFSR